MAEALVVYMLSDSSVVDGIMIILIIPTALRSPATANTDAYCIISNGVAMYDWGSLNNSTTNSYGIIDKNFNHI